MRLSDGPGGRRAAKAGTEPPVRKPHLAARASVSKGDRQEFRVQVLVAHRLVRLSGMESGAA